MIKVCVWAVFFYCLIWSLSLVPILNPRAVWCPLHSVLMIHIFSRNLLKVGGRHWATTDMQISLRSKTTTERPDTTICPSMKCWLRKLLCTLRGNDPLLWRGQSGVTWVIVAIGESPLAENYSSHFPGMYCPGRGVVAQIVGVVAGAARGLRRSAAVRSRWWRESSSDQSAMGCGSERTAWDRAGSAGGWGLNSCLSDGIQPATESYSEGNGW